jgi:hypothetical protein
VFADDDDSIMIENINDIVETLLLFQNERRTAGGTIKSHLYDEKSKNLIIHYDNPLVAAKVLEKGNVEHNGKTYHAKKICKKTASVNKSKLLTSFFIKIPSFIFFYFKIIIIIIIKIEMRAK